MTTPEKTAVASHLAIIALCAVVAFAVIELVNTIDKTLDGVNATLAIVNRPGTGTLAEVNKAAVKSGDAIVTTQRQELAVVKRISPVLDSLATVAPHVNGTMDSLSGTATAASSSLQTITEHVTPVLDSTKSTVADVGTAITTQSAALSKSQADFQAVLTGFEPVEKNVGTITDNFGAMSTTANAKFQLFMNPPPCRNWKCHIGQTIEIMKTASSFIEPAFYLKEMFSGQVISGTVTVNQPKGTP